MAGNLVAFDIGEAQVKLAWYSGTVRKKAVAAPLPDGLVANGAVVSMDAMADFLKKLAKDSAIPRTSAALILPGSLVFTRNVELPAMTDAQLNYNLPFEFKDYLTQEKGLYYFDYAVHELVKDEAGNVTQMRLFACAALKQTIEDYRAMLKRAGFRLKIAIPEEAAYAGLLASYISRTPNSAGQDYALVDLGYSAIRLHILHGSEFVTRRTMDLGLRDVIQALSESRGVDPHIAHEHLLSDYEGALNEPVCQDVYRSMAVEIMKAVNFYNYNNREQTLSRIYLCGGGAALTEISDAIQEMSSLELHPVSELISGSETLQTPWLFAKAIGCALQ